MRLFLALELPAAVARPVAALRERLRGELGGWRWVSAHGIHLTVRFLGEVDGERDRALRGGWCAAVSAVPAFRMRARGLGRFPERGRPRVLWVGVEETAPGGALATLARSLEATARASGFPAEPRPFRPHLTLARAARDGSPTVPPNDRAWETAEGWVREVVLFRSLLRPTGPSYTALDRFPLAAGPDVPDGGGAA